MDPIKINITVTLDASDKLASLVQALVAGKPEAPATKPAPKPVETKPEPRKPEVKKDPVPAQPAEDPKPEQPEEAPEKAKEITDSELRVFIKGIRDQVGSNKAIWDVFADFGIKTSIECPMERRAELMERLNKLVA
jgi:hypothetical protein